MAGIGARGASPQLPMRLRHPPVRVVRSIGADVSVRRACALDGAMR